MPRTILVTGGARGIGRGIAHAFLANGDRVMIADLPDGGKWNYELASARDRQAALTEAQSLGEVAATDLDVTDQASCEAAVQATLSRFGGLDVLVNNAGVIQSGPIEAFSQQDWDRVFAVNVKGVFLMTQAALPPLKASSDAAIVNTASIAGKQGFPNLVAYCGSKFAVVGITQALAAELAPTGIRVNALCPGMVGTAMWLEHLMPANTADEADQKQQFEEAMASRIPLGRPQTVEDMGQAALYLASAVNVTGVSLSVAGGFEMN